MTTIKREELEDVTVDGIVGPPPSEPPPEVELVTMNGDIINTFKRVELEQTTVDEAIFDLCQGNVRGA